MSFYLINRDPDSPIMALKSSSLPNLELIFKERESVKVFPECLDDKGPFKVVWLEGNEVKIRTVASRDDYSFEALISHPISEHDIEILLTTLVDHGFLKQEYQQIMLHELTHHFAKMRLVDLQVQARELLERIIRVEGMGEVYLDRVSAREKISITQESKANVTTSRKQLKQIMECITKLMTEKKGITKEEIEMFQTFKSSCHIKTESPVKGWYADQSFADAVALFARDFDKFLTEAPSRCLSVGATRFVLYKPSSDKKLLAPEDKSPWKTCTIL